MLCCSGWPTEDEERRKKKKERKKEKQKKVVVVWHPFQKEVCDIPFDQTIYTIVKEKGYDCLVFATICYRIETSDNINLTQGTPEIELKKS